MARVLIVGCGCRGRLLAEAVRADGHAVRGTTRDASGLEAIEAAGAEGVVADPDRLGTLMRALAGVTAVCWLLGSADDALATLNPWFETVTSATRVRHSEADPDLDSIRDAPLEPAKMPMTWS